MVTGTKLRHQITEMGWKVCVTNGTQIGESGKVAKNSKAPGFMPWGSKPRICSHPSHIARYYKATLIPVLILTTIFVTLFATLLPESFVHLLAATSVSLSWEKVFGGSGADWLRCVQAAPDGGFVVVGAWNYTEAQGTSRGLIAKISSSGKVEWLKKIGSEKMTVFESVCVERDGFVAAGYTNRKGAGSFDAYLVKTDFGGNILWEKTIGQSKEEKLYSIRVVSDGYVAAGEATSRIAHGDTEAYLIKTNKKGTLLWEKFFGEDAHRDGAQIFEEVLPDIDGGFILCGYTAEALIGSIDVYMVKTDSSGKRLWEKSFGTRKTDMASSVIRVGGSYILAGVSSTRGMIWRVKNGGSLEWKKEMLNGYFHGLIRAVDGSAIAVGFASQPDGSIMGCAVSFDPSKGTKLWESALGGSPLSSIYCAANAADGGVALAGVSSSTALGAKVQDCYVAKLSFAITAPRLQSISPTSGTKGARVTLTGSGFGYSRLGTAFVKFGDVPATEYLEWSSEKIVVRVPDVLPGVVRVTVVLGGTVSNGVSFTVRELSGERSFYFAEGYVSDSFDAYLCLGNAGNADSKALVTLMFNGAPEMSKSVAVPGKSRVTLRLNDMLKEGTEFSILVRCESSLVFAERPMYFSYAALAGGEYWDGGHCVTGAPAPAVRWLFAEGTTRDEFDEWLTVMNPGRKKAHLTFRYMIEGEGEKEVKGEIAPRSRATFLVRDHIGSGKDASLLLESDLPVVAERPMYFRYGGYTGWSGGHCAVGVNWAESRWYFPEGTTRSGFDEWLCLQNPNEIPIRVNATYMLGEGQGENMLRSYEVRPKERLTVYVNKEVGFEKDVSILLLSDMPFVAERPMYFDYRGGGVGHWTGGHVIPGAMGLLKRSFFAEGYTGDGFEQWLCLMNPNETETGVRITYFDSHGGVTSRTVTIPARTRLTLSANADAGAGKEISTLVESDRPLICERPIYFNYAGRITGGHTVLGYGVD